MPVWVYFVASYGLAFGLQNDKAAWLTSRLTGKWPLGGFFTNLLACTYCTGFHTGWKTFLAWSLVEGPVRPLDTPENVVTNVVALFIWAFCSTVFCYGLDAFIQWMELSAPREE